tara:strand:- start:717 stop:962 length:246 start_codon:yes stop_codon:yes gene_type:complete
MEDIFDFGFTAMDADELDVVQQAKQVVTEAEGTSEKLNNLYNAILPLLNNLKMNPEKDYIYWPNRTAKIEQFEEKIANIIK